MTSAQYWRAPSTQARAHWRLGTHQAHFSSLSNRARATGSACQVLGRREAQRLPRRPLPSRDDS
jgi:hypothetical protein